MSKKPNLASVVEAVGSTRRFHLNEATEAARSGRPRTEEPLPQNRNRWLDRASHRRMPANAHRKLPPTMVSVMLNEDRTDRRGMWRFFASEPWALNVRRQVLVQLEAGAR